MDIKEKYPREAPPELKDMLRAMASEDEATARRAGRQFAQAVETPLRKGNLFGDVTGDIFTAYTLDPGAQPVWPLDIVVPGTENQYSAYAVPAQGRLPERYMEGDYIMVPGYRVGNAIDWAEEFARFARWDVVARMLEVFEAGFIKKKNDDVFHLLLAAALGRNILVSDPNAGAGRLTLRFITLMRQTMRRAGGGNMASLGGRDLTDLYTSIETAEDMLNWGAAEVPEAVRNAIHSSPNGYLASLWNIRFHPMFEFGYQQEYQNFYLDPAGLNGQLAAGDVELVLGLDLGNGKGSTFVNPIIDPLRVKYDHTQERAARLGIFGRLQEGLAITDSSKLLLGSV